MAGISYNEVLYTIITAVSVITLIITVVGFYVKIRIDITKINRDYMALRTEFDNNRIDTQKDIRNLQKDNKEDHKQLFDKIDTLKTDLTKIILNGKGY